MSIGYAVGISDDAQYHPRATVSVQFIATRSLPALNKLLDGASCIADLFNAFTDFLTDSQTAAADSTAVMNSLCALLVGAPVSDIRSLRRDFLLPRLKKLLVEAIPELAINDHSMFLLILQFIIA